MNLLTRLQAQRDKLLAARDRALDQKGDFGLRLAALEAGLRDAEEALRKSKRAALLGGHGRLTPEREAGLVRTLTEMPIEAAALRDVIEDMGKKVVALDEDIRVKDVEISHARLDVVEAELLRARLEEFALRDALDALSRRQGSALDWWRAVRRQLKELGNDGRRPWIPQDYPDRYHHDTYGHERSRQEEATIVQARINELEVRLDGRREVSTVAVP